VRVLFDQGTPAPLRRHLPLHSVETTHERGWATLRNGDFLRAAENAGFEVLITTDQHLQYQQNLAERRIGIGYRTPRAGLAFAPRRTPLRTPWLDVQRSGSSRSAFREDAEQQVAVGSRDTNCSLRSRYLIRLQLHLKR